MRAPNQTALWLLLALLWSGCGDEASQPQLNYTLPDTGTQGDDQAEPEPDPVQEELDNFQPPPVADICQEGQVRCLATRSGATLACVSQQTSGGQSATRWVESACPQDQVCINNACAAFSCVPQEPACDGAGLQGICDATGASLVNRQPCPQGTTCRGGVCVDLCDSAARARSYIGCDYMLVSLPNPVNDVGNSSGEDDGPYGLVVSNPEPLQTVTISVLRQDGQPARVRPQVQVNIPEDAGDFLQGQPAQTVHSTVLSKDRQPVATLEGDAVDIEIPPGGLATLLLEIDRLPYRGTGVYDVAQRLRSSHPVVAYQFSPYCCNYTFTNDASLLLPTTALGTQYTALGAPEWQELPPGLTVVATQDGTEVSLSLPEGQATSRLLGDVDDLGQGQLRATLQAGQSLYVDTPEDLDLFSDLTGTTVEASAPVAVFSSHLCTFLPHSQPACDHLEEQLIPSDTWGSEYVLSTPERRGQASREYTYWRVLAGEQGATFDLGVPLHDLDTLAPFSSQLINCRFFRVSGEGDQKFYLPPNRGCTVGTRRSTTLSADTPLQVMGFMAGEAAASSGEGTSIGDPSMFLLAPVEQFRDDYTFLTPETYAQDYMTLVLLRDAAGGLTLDGAPVDPQDPGLRAEPVLGSRYMLLHVPVGDGVHRVEGTAPFGLLVYAYDRYVSYAYTGGLNLTKRAR